MSAMKSYLLLHGYTLTPLEALAVTQCVTLTHLRSSDCHLLNPSDLYKSFPIMAS